MNTTARTSLFGLAMAALALVVGACDDGSTDAPPPPRTVVAPAFAPDGGNNFTSSVEVTITTTTTGASIRYTTDGSAPTDTDGLLYSAPFSLDTVGVFTLKAIAYKDGMTRSAVVTRTFTISAPGQVVAPTFSPDAGTFDTAQSVTLTSETADADVYYTMTADGTDPAEPTTSATQFTGPFSLAQSDTAGTAITYRIKAIAVKSEMVDSFVSTAEYVIDNPAIVGSLVEDFQDEAIGFEFGELGWGATDIVADVVDDPLAPGNNVLRVTTTNYNAAPVITLQIPAGKTLADYNSFTFRGYFAEGDVGWKHVQVYEFGTAPTGAFANAGTPLGDYDRARGPSTAWEDITVDISSNTSSLTGTVYLAFGYNGNASVWYADDVTLVE